MAITPASDIVLDVARAADPDRYRAAVDRLARLRATADAAAPAPAAAFDAALSPSAADRPAPTSAPAAGASRSNVRSGLNAYGQFEAFVLQSFLQSMMPRNATSVFGKGTAGEFWRSMLAEKMGDELARSGQVGIARRLAAGPNPSAQAVSIANPPAPPPTLVSTLNHTHPPLPAAVQAVDPRAPSLTTDGDRT